VETVRNHSRESVNMSTKCITESICQVASFAIQALQAKNTQLLGIERTCDLSQLEHDQSARCKLSPPSLNLQGSPATPQDRLRDLQRRLTASKFV
jgi:hypothetical protein